MYSHFERIEERIRRLEARFARMGRAQRRATAPMFGAPGVPSARVLIVDRSPLTICSLTVALRPHCHVMATTDAAHALDMLDHRVAILIAGVEQDGIDGAELLQRAKTRQASTKRVLSAEYPPIELANLVQSGVVDRFLPKPLDVRELLEYPGLPRPRPASGF